MSAPRTGLTDPQSREDGIGEFVELALGIIGRVVDVSNAHGTCYLVELPQRDFTEPRRVWLDADEVVR